MQKLLCSLKICDQDAIAPFFPRVRDRDDVSVLKCGKSGVIFLSGSDHLTKNHYQNRSDLMYWGNADRKTALLKTVDDDQRRSGQFRDEIEGRFWLDIGTGLGGILDFLAPVASRVIAVEPQTGARECL